jgi:hypothetical protein
MIAGHLFNVLDLDYINRRTMHRGFGLILFGRELFRLSKLGEFSPSAWKPGQ